MADLDLVPQPDFGERMRRLRVQRGLKQSDLTGDSLSASYVSRIESGSRAVTPHLARLLADRLGVEVSVFHSNRDAALADALVEAQQALAAGDYEAAVSVFESVVDNGPVPLAVEWSARQSLATALCNLGRLSEWRQHQARMLTLADEAESPRLLVMAYTGLSSCLRCAGEIDSAYTAARSAVEQSEHPDVPDSSRLLAMISLIAAESEAGRAGDAASHAEDVVGMLTDRTPSCLRAKVLWAAASAQVDRGSFDQTMTLLQKAMAELRSGEDLITWARLRLAAVSLHYRAGRSLDPEIRESFAVASQVLRLTGIPIYQAQLDLLEAEVAFGEQRFHDAEALCSSALTQANLLSFRDRAQARILKARAVGHTGQPDRAIRELRAVAQELDNAGARDLSAGAWRMVAELALMSRASDH